MDAMIKKILVLITFLFTFQLYGKQTPTPCSQDGMVCIGMDLETLKSKYPNAAFNSVAMYSYGYDSDETGIEIILNGDVYFFVNVNIKNKITGISFVSPTFEFNGISTETTIGDIFNKYPESILYIDLISDWEYIYIKEEAILLNFQTNESNRIGIYGDDIEDGTKNIKRKNAKINLISL